jgi:hypothetical protein
VDWQSIISITAVAIALLAALDRRFDSSMSIREHEEFKNNVDRLFVNFQHQRERDIDILADRVKLLEQTRPTIGELEARLNEARLLPK